LSGARTLPFAAVRGTWSRERIVAALLDWAGEFGRAPRRSDFAPELARALGLAGSEETVWEQRHPRYPSRGAVEWHFGSWREALAAAGLPHRPEPELPLDDRVRAARSMLGGGMSRSAVADALGVSVGSVRNYVLAGKCAQCATGFVISRRGVLCLRCAQDRVAAQRPKARSREAVLEAIRVWESEIGCVPREGDWRVRPRGPRARSDGKWEAEFPRWPTGADVRRYWPTWADAVREAGLRPTLVQWTRAQCDAALLSLVADLGRTPTTAELRAAAIQRRVPSTPTIASRYGSVRDAWKALGVAPRRPVEYSDEELLELLAAGLAAFGRRPTEREWREQRRSPDASTIRARFGSFRAGFDRAAGLRPA
jgi:hypothetical protein